MKNKAKLIVLVFVALIAGLIFWAVRTVPQAQVQTEPAAEDKMMKYTNNTIKEEKNGVKLWELSAEEITVDPDTSNVTLKNIAGQFYQTNGTVVSLKAPHAFYQVQEKNVKIDGGVATETSDGAKIDSQTLVWEETTAKLTGEGNVRITKDDAVAVGDKIESTDGFQNFKLMGHAHITKGRAQ